MAKNNLDTLEKIPGDTPEAKYDNICKMKEILCKIIYREASTTKHEFSDLIQKTFSLDDLS
jgi:hypothetical protein